MLTKRKSGPDLGRVESDLEPGKPFINIFSLFMSSGTAERQMEYCVSLQLNAMNSDVRHIYLLAEQREAEVNRQLIDCQLRGRQREKFTLFAGVNATYASLLHYASRKAGPTQLNVVANTDIVLGNWSEFGSLRGCLWRIYQRWLGLALSRWEPKECFPSLDRSMRMRRKDVEKVPDLGTYNNLCPVREWAARSRDVLALNRRVPTAALRLLDFPPNRLGAENLLSCVLTSFGFFLYNPCRELSIFHNHCSDIRNYPRARIDGDATPNPFTHGRHNATLINGKYKRCAGHAIEPVELQNSRVCGLAYRAWNRDKRWELHRWKSPEPKPPTMHTE